METFVGCQKESDIIPDAVPAELKKYFESEDYADLKENFAFGLSNFYFDNIVEENPTPEVTIYYVRIEKNDRFGILAIFSKSNGEAYKSLFEDRSELKEKTNGLIQVFTAKNFFVVDFNFEKQSMDDTTVKMQINRVGNVETSAPRLKGGAEFPNPADGFWRCTSDCYDYIKQECNGWCSFLCGAADYAYYSCSIGQMGGCAAYCF